MKTRLLLLASAALIAGPVWAQEASPAPIVIQAPPPADPPVAVPSEVVDPTPAAPAIPAVWAPVPVDRTGTTAYGLYLSGRMANIRGDREAGAELLTDTLRLTPEQPTISEETFRVALFSGDLDEVARLADTPGLAPELVAPGRLVKITRALQRRDGRAAQAELTSAPLNGPYAFAARYISRPVAAAAGDWNTALAPVPATVAREDTLNQAMQRRQRAALLESRRRYDEAEAEYVALAASPLASLFTNDHAAFLERRGRRDDAKTIYEAVVASQTPDPEALLGLQRIERRERAPALRNPNQLASDGLAFAANELDAADAQGRLGFSQLTALYHRLSDTLDPSPLGRVQLGRALDRADQKEQARAVYAAIPQSNPIIYALAQYQLGMNWQEAEQNDQALAAFRRAAAAAPEQHDITAALVGQLMVQQQYDEALAILDHPAVRDSQDPVFRFWRGAALEKLGRLDEAEAELQAALAAAPDNATLLNHLGYMWVDSGRKVEEGAAMIQRALSADPDNGNIQDSLGWAQFRQGQFDAAVTTLEGAVEKEPANAEIVDHLGDAYWRVGRRREAEWQWSRVLTLEPEAGRRAEVEEKLRQGLDGPSPITVPATPAGEP